MNYSVKILLPVLLLLFAACGNETEQKHEPHDTVPADSTKSHAYTCPCGHCGFEGSNEPGDCPKCGMELTKK